MRACINGATTRPYALEEDLIAAGIAGFRLVEIWAGKLQTYLERHTVTELRRSLAAAGVAVAAICPYRLQCFGDWRQGLAAVERATVLAAELGAPALLVCPDAPGSEEAGPEALARAGERARAYAETAARSGVRLAIEPLGGHRFVPGPREAMALIRAAGSPLELGLMLDTFHYYKSGVPDTDVDAVPAERWVILHVNDCPPGPATALRDADRLYPGEGILPLVATLRHFRDIGFSGAASVEVFRPEYWELPIAEINRRAYASVSQILQAVSGEGGLS